MISIFAFAMITIYLQGRGYRLVPLMSLIPGAWYAFITVTYLANASIGFNIPINIAYIIGTVFALVYAAVVCRYGIKLRNTAVPLESDPVYT